MKRRPHNAIPVPKIVSINDLILDPIAIPITVPITVSVPVYVHFIHTSSDQDT